MSRPDNPQIDRTMSHPVVNSAVANTLKAGLAGLPVVQFTAPSRMRAFGSN